MIDNSYDTKPMTNEEIVENLKTMVFGVQAFERFNAKERETLDRAWNTIDQYENLKADRDTKVQVGIDEHIKILELYNNGGYAGCLQETIDVAIDTMRKYQQLQADYENLKANIVTMLEDKFISKSDVDRIINCPYFRQADKLIQIMNLPSVTFKDPCDTGK